MASGAYNAGMTDQPDQKKHAPHEKPVSLYPLHPEEALKKLLKAKPQHRKGKAQQDQDDQQKRDESGQ